MRWVLRGYSMILVLVAVAFILSLFGETDDGSSASLAATIVAFMGSGVLAVLAWRSPSRQFGRGLLFILGSLVGVIGLFGIGVEIDGLIGGGGEDPATGWLISSGLLLVGAFAAKKSYGRKEDSAPTVLASENDTQDTMPTSEDHRFFREFALRKKRQIAISIPIWLVMIFTFAAADVEDAYLFGVAWFVWVPVVAVLLIVLVVFSIRNWRCPRCAKYMGKAFNPRYCQHCGGQLKV